MCGIAGVVSHTSGGGEELVSRAELFRLMAGIETRGGLATGIAYCTEYEVRYLKAPCDWISLVTTDEFLSDLNMITHSSWVLLHSRLPSHGDVYDNRNNHPIVNEHGLIIHNGVVSIDDNTFPAQGETDTEQLLLCIQKYGFAGLEKISGSVAIAYVDFERPGDVYLYRNSMSPCYWYKESRRLVFASTAQILQTSLLIKQTIEEQKAGIVFRASEGGVEEVMKVKTKPGVTMSFPWYQDSSFFSWGR